MATKAEMSKVIELVTREYGFVIPPNAVVFDSVDELRAWVANHPAACQVIVHRYENGAIMVALGEHDLL